MTKRMYLIRFLNAIWIYILAGVLTGSYTYRFLKGELPCPLCMLQRLSLICVAIGPMLNLRYKVKVQHYALSLAASIFGGAVSLRQIGLHVCPQFPTFGQPVLGLELYTWAFLVFSASAVGIMVLLLLHPKEHDNVSPGTMFLYEKIACGYIFLLALANIFTTYLICGFGSCQG